MKFFLEPLYIYVMYFFSFKKCYKTNVTFQQRQQFIILLAITINKQILNRMELEQSEIINLAVNIFQNVGIKRYIGQIEALRHEDIYFEIYKIIFPDSMINIFKISQSNLTTGQKIQKIIQEISSIIKLDLYHISGEAIAQGNRKDLTNWLQLLQALSNNCIAYQSYNAGGSAPDRDREMQIQFEEDDYYTVQGVDGEFQKHVYTDEKADSDQSYRQQYSYQQSEPKNKKQKYPIQPQTTKKQKHRHPQDPSQKSQNKLDESFIKSESQRSSSVLQPIQTKKKISGKAKKSKKKVTFKIEEGQNSHKNILQNQKLLKTTIKKQHPEIDKKTASSLRQPENHMKLSKRQVAICQQYGYPAWVSPSQQQRLLRKKKSFISKMHKIEQQMEQKKTNDQMTKFQQWAYKANAQSVKDRMLIQQQNNQRTSYINKKIIEREQFINSLSGADEALMNIKQMFKKQKLNEKRMRKVMLYQQRKQARELMDLNFAADVENMVMATIGE